MFHLTFICLWSVRNSTCQPLHPDLICVPFTPANQPHQPDTYACPASVSYSVFSQMFDSAILHVLICFSAFDCDAILQDVQPNKNCNNSHHRAACRAQMQVHLELDGSCQQCRARDVNRGLAAQPLDADLLARALAIQRAVEAALRDRWSGQNKRAQSAALYSAKPAGGCSAAPAMQQSFITNCAHKSHHTQSANQSSQQQSRRAPGGSCTGVRRGWT